MAKRETFLGGIALTGLVHEAIINKGKKGIFIPIDDNPCIYINNKDDGTRIISLDIEVKPTPSNQYGHSHLVKANVGKANRQKFGLQGEALDKAQPILGNLRRFEFESKDGGPAPQAPHADPGDMPEELATW